MKAVYMVAAVLVALPVGAGQVKTNVPDPVPGARPATIERITIHGPSLEGNLEGDAVDRAAIVFLPPGYHQSRTRRYPVVYALHGYSIGADQWSQEIHVPQTIEGAKRAGLAGIAVTAGSTVVAEPARIGSAADREKLFVIGVRAETAAR